MGPRRYELSDFEWSIIQPLLPNKPRGEASPKRDEFGLKTHKRVLALVEIW